MTRSFAIRHAIAAPAERVWMLLTDTEFWPRWGPSVVAVDCAQRFIERGSTGRVKTALGAWLSFAITEYEPDCYWRWRVAGIPATGHRVEPLGRQRCRLLFEIPIIAAPYAAVCHVASRRLARLAEGDSSAQ
ncbi:MAG: SRPBCC family protein [Myxococcota bacterium]